MSKCKYCGSSSYGGCSYSPHKKHEHIADGSSVCRYCGLNTFGGCSYSPYGKHEHC
ncbi:MULTISPECIES: hypothetical protein [unclassified Campylobacter]|uniref:hypothetical protein n=1 Tax=unclassified Campylobacter TaxID=2593542 RepID=UPI001BDB2E3D|nr:MULTISPECIES: hypothetical protein [unclassified Campylobacter]MBT0879778.1 hypothetical protein [Campylobacter sp. 2018MI27]MBT0885112.1 hypothetical protein [Campylobacter sp. 2018MI10]